MKKIAIISGSYSDFQKHVADIYNNSELPKTKLRVGNRVSITSKGAETEYVLVQSVDDVRGLLADGYEELFSAIGVVEYGAIMDEIRFRQAAHK